MEPPIMLDQWRQEREAGMLPPFKQQPESFPCTYWSSAKLTEMAGGVWCLLPIQCLEESQRSSQPREEQRMWMQH